MRDWMMRSQRGTLLAMALLLAVTLAACADDDDNSSGATEPAPAATATDPQSQATEAATPTQASAPTEPATTSTATQQPPAATSTAPPAPTATATGEAGSVGPFDPEAVALDVELVAEGFNRPLLVTHAGDGSGRVFVVEQDGVIRLLDGTIALDINDRVGSGGNEQGLLGLAFHPDFATNQWLYVYYTDNGGHTVVSRFTMGEDGVIDPDSEQAILTQQQPAFNHNGGMLAFGPDGYLYIGLGDGGRSYDAFGMAQNLGEWLGKILRIDVDGGDPYAIPPDNPFVGVDGAREEIWAFGLRNPWRFSFDRETGDLYIGDVGQGAVEWVHFQPAGSPGGQNYGWPVFEGSLCLIEERCGEEGFTPPIATFSQDEGNCANIGGYVYRGDAVPALRGAYLNGDLCTGHIWATARDGGEEGEWRTTLMLTIDAQISSFGEDEAGELYVTDIAGGRVLRVVVREA